MMRNRDTVNKTTATVDVIGTMNFEGNVIPSSWYRNVRMKSGRVDLVAITVLADIIYWYRPKEIRAESGELVETHKRFAEDKLRRAYSDWDFMGLTKEQARDACHRLRDLGLITIEYRTKDWEGTKVCNIVYLEPIPDAIAAITYRHVRRGVSTSRGTPPLPDVETNTEITTETTSERGGADAPLVKDDASPKWILDNDQNPNEGNARMETSLLPESLTETTTETTSENHMGETNVSPRGVSSWPADAARTFSEMTGIPIPRRSGKSNVLWAQPLREIESFGEGYLAEAIRDMQRRKLFIASPKSVLTVARQLSRSGNDEPDYMKMFEEHRCNGG